MKTKLRERENERRNSVIIIIVILLLGFICIIITSGWALRFAPSWKLDTNMGSNLNPNSDFLTGRPVSFFEPLDSAILTQPAWINVFLTPGISFPMRTALPTGTPTLNPVPSNTNTPIPTFTTVPTNTLVIVVIPPATTTPKPPPPPPPSTNTPVVPPPSADLQITNTDSATNYDANVTSVQYIIVVSNAGPNAVTGATVTDTSSANLTSVTWTCVGSGGASCTASGAGDINDSVNLPVGTSITYAVNATVVGASGPLVNTATVSSPAGMTDPTPSNNSATDTDQVIAAASFLLQLTTNGDGLILNISTSSFLDLQLPSSLSSTSQVIYYPDPTAPPPPLQIDVVILQLGDGKNWYTILNWGDGVPDANTDIPAAPACVASETDNCAIDPTLLTNSPGITIDLSGLPVGITYSYIRIKSPSNPPDSGDGVSIDAIVVVP